MRIEVDRGLTDSIIVEDTMGDRVMMTTDHGWTTLSEPEAMALIQGLMEIIVHNRRKRIDHWEEPDE